MHSASLHAPGPSSLHQLLLCQLRDYSAMMLYISNNCITGAVQPASEQLAPLAPIKLSYLDVFRFL